MRRRRLSRWVVSDRLAAVRRIARPSDASVERAVRFLIMLGAGVANLIGAVAVFVISVWVLPTDQLVGDDPPILTNLVFAGIFMVGGLLIGAWWGLKRLRPGRRWLKEERPPTAAEQRNLLRAPLHVAFVIGCMWFLAAAFFGIYNAAFAIELGQRVFVTVLLGGLVTGAVAYLLIERLLRPAAARALAELPLEKPALPGVTARFLFTWAIAAGIPLLSVALVSISALVEADFTRNQLAIAVLGLSVGAIAIGFFGVLLAARVTADPIISVRDAIGEIERGDLDTEVPVYDGTEVGMLQSGFNRMVEGIRERERIRELFGMHVGEDVARAALERGGGLGGEIRQVAVLFVDMIGSTAIAAERPADEVVALLNRFFGVVVEVVDSNSGWVNKFEGDAALAIFGAPEPLGDAPGCALAAGRELSRRLASEIDDAGAGIGVSFGTVVAGNIGSDQRFEYTVIGDAVNEAARLTELAKDQPGCLLASGAAVAAAAREEQDHWTLTESVQLRGRAELTQLALASESVGDELPGPGEPQPAG